MARLTRALPSVPAAQRTALTRGGPSPSQIARIVRAWREGGSVGITAGVAGISRATLERWVYTGQVHQADDVDSPCRVMVEAMILERAHRGLQLLTLINKAALTGDVRVAQWLLERQYPESFGALPSEPATLGSDYSDDGLIDLIEEIAGKQAPDLRDAIEAE